MQEEYHGMRPIAAALCAFCLSPPLHAAVNLIADGGFEAHPAQPGGIGHTAGGTSFDGGAWHVTGVDILQVDTAFRDNSNPPVIFTAHGGRGSLDVTGTGNSGPADGVFQDVATQAGLFYQLSFWVGHASTSGSAHDLYSHAATMRLSIDGGAPIDFVNADQLENRIAWKQFTVGFVATGNSTRIAFVNGLGNDYLGLDDVALSTAGSVPELPQWAMMGGGFGMAGVVLRRTAKRAPA